MYLEDSVAATLLGFEILNSNIEILNKFKLSKFKNFKQKIQSPRYNEVLMISRTRCRLILYSGRSASFKAL